MILRHVTIAPFDSRRLWHSVIFSGVKAFYHGVRVDPHSGDNSAVCIDPDAMVKLLHAWE